MSGIGLFTIILLMNCKKYENNLRFRKKGTCLRDLCPYFKTIVNFIYSGVLNTRIILQIHKFSVELNMETLLLYAIFKQLYFHYFAKYC